MYLFLLLSHITLGTVSIIFCLATIVGMVFKKNLNYLGLMKIIGAISSLSIVSGIGLFFIQAIQLSVFQFCLRLGIYLAVILFTEVLLYNQNRFSLTKTKVFPAGRLVPKNSYRFNVLAPARP